MENNAGKPTRLIDGRHLTLDLPANDIESALEAIRDTFGLSWLAETGQEHPLRNLWSRQDFIATQELYLLGSSIIELRKINTTWLKDAIKKVKALDPSRAGAVFEIVAIAALLRGGHQVTPAKINGRDIDLDVVLANRETMRISLKHHGATWYEKHFRKKAKFLLERINAAAQKAGRRWHGVLACCDKFPDKDSDWLDLQEALIERAGASDASFPVGKWKVHYEQSPLPEASLASIRLSYSLRVIVPHHENEAKSFDDKLELDCLPLNKAAAGYPPNIRAALMLRLSENANFEKHIQWAKEYVNRPETAIAGIFLMQSAIVQNIIEDSTSIVHTMDAAWRNGVPAPELRMVVTTGKCSQKQMPYSMIINDRIIPMFGIHSFFESEIFSLTNFDPAGTTISNMNVAPGRTLHGGFRMGNEEFILSPKFKTPDQLTLFS